MSKPVTKLPLGNDFGTRAAWHKNNATVQGYRAREVFRQTENFSFTPDSGWTSEIAYHGPIETLAIFAKKTIKEYKDDDYRVTVDISDLGNGFGNMTVRVPSRLGDEKEYEDEDTVQWSLTGNDMEKDILTHPSLAGPPVIVDDEWDILRKLKADPNVTIPNESSVSIATWNIIQLIRKGVQTHSVSQWVLRRSSVLMSEQSTTTQIADVGYQFGISELQTYENLPTTIKFTLPTSGVWIKRTPSIALEGTRYKVDGEFWHADTASSVLFPVKT
jgi:hypothetical protein|tara:strand:+ start:8412 stop:9233 length:822 start_codon:yes stop_codon:yes gene_type:complete